MGRWLNLHRRETIGVLCVLLVCVAVPVFAGDGTVSWGDKVILFLASLFGYVAQGVVKLISLLIDIVVVPIMKYNNFAYAPVVDQGWKVIRDLVNMFFVVVLLIIAFQTIFSVGRADWKKQVPRLLIMAVVINFSRTIAGLLIDFGQVVMLTFVNAIADVAGGNFIKLFGLDGIFSWSDAAVYGRVGSGAGSGPFDLFVAAFLTMILTFVILATMLMLAALLAFRIVILWCLIIVSPLTFFLGGAKGVVGPAESYYADWWKRFTSAVSLGPILTFFVWLSLAAASGGNLATEQGFQPQTDAATGTDANTGSILTKAFDAPHMTSLIIAIALLFAGFEVSQQTASSMGGRAAALASSGIKGIPGLARGLGKLSLPFAAVGGTAAAVGGAAGVAAVGYGTGVALVGGAAGVAYGKRRGFGKETYLKKKEEAGEFIRDKGKAFAGTAIGRLPIFAGAAQATAQAGIGLTKSVDHQQEADLAEAQKLVSGSGFEGLRTYIALMKNGGYKDKMNGRAAVESLLGSEEKRNKLSTEDLMEYSSVMANQVLPFADEKTKDKWGRTLVESPILAVGQGLKTAGLKPKEGQSIEKAMQEDTNEGKAIKKVVEDAVATQLSEQVSLSRGNFNKIDPVLVGKSAIVRSAMSKVVFSTTKDGKVETGAEYVSSGKSTKPIEQAMESSIREQKREYEQKKRERAEAAEKQIQEIVARGTPPTTEEVDSGKQAVLAGIGRGAVPGYNPDKGEGEFHGNAAEQNVRSQFVQQLVADNPTVVVDMKGVMDGFNEFKNDLSKAVSNGITLSGINGMRRDYMSAADGSFEQNRLAESMRLLLKALNANSAAVKEGPEKLKAIKALVARLPPEGKKKSRKRSDGTPADDDEDEDAAT